MTAKQLRLKMKQEEEPKPPLIIRWYALWHTPLKERWQDFKVWVRPYLTWRMAICFGIAWVLIDGWPYVLLPISIYYKIDWLIVVCTTCEAILWFPFTIEKPIVVLIAVFLKKGLDRLIPPRKKGETK